MNSISTTVQVIDWIVIGLTIASIFIFIGFSCQNQFQSPVKTIIQFLMLSSMLICLADISSLTDSDITDPQIQTDLCTIQGIIRQIGHISSILWSTLLGFLAPCMINNSSIFFSNRITFLQIGVVLISTFIAFFPIIFTGALDIVYDSMDSSTICWINVHENNSPQQLFIAYLATFIGIFCVCSFMIVFWFIKLKALLKQHPDFQHISLERQFLYPGIIMAFYFIIVIVVTVGCFDSSVNLWGGANIIIRNLATILIVLIYIKEREIWSKTSMGTSAPHLAFADLYESKNISSQLNPTTELSHILLKRSIKKSLYPDF